MSLSDTANFTHTYDFTTGINGDLGVTTHVIIPSGGTVLIEAGRVLSDDQETCCSWPGSAGRPAAAY